MGKKVYTVNGKMYIIDDETGDVKTIYIKDEQITQNDMKELLKVILKDKKEKDE
jgi:hypothetical protein